MISILPLVLTIANAAVLLQATESQVPVLMWTNSNHQKKTNFLDEVSAGAHLSGEDFNRNYVQTILNSDDDGARTFVAFIQDKLSVEDFTKYGKSYKSGEPAAYRYIKSLVSGGGGVRSVFLPSVDSPSSHLTPSTPVPSQWTVTSVKSGQYDLKGVSFNNGQRNLILIYLPKIGTSEDVESGIRKNDEIVEQVVKYLEKEKQKYTAIFTGLKPSHIPPPVYPSHDRLRRDLPDVGDDDNSTAHFYQLANCTYFYTKNITLEVGKELVSLTTKGKVADDSRCMAKNSSESGRLHLQFDEVSSDVKNLDVWMDFRTSKGYWSVNQVNVSYEVNGTSRQHPLIISDWAAPAGWSYHCDRTPVLRGTEQLNSSDIIGTVGFQFGSLQIQASDGSISKGEFGRAYDCRGFFSPGILMGIVVGALLLFIFSYGMAMVANLKTNDRFDDPKGKMIMVPQAGE